MTWITIIVMIVIGLGSYFAGYRDGKRTEQRRQVEADVEQITSDEYLRRKDDWDDMP